MCKFSVDYDRFQVSADDVLNIYKYSIQKHDIKCFDYLNKCL